MHQASPGGDRVSRTIAALRDWTPEEITTLTTSLDRFANDLILEASR